MPLLSRTVRLILSGMLSIALSVCTASHVRAQGYSIRRNSVAIDSRGHWANWTFLEGTVDITPGGVVRPRFIRRNIDAVADAGDFGGGIRAAGSNASDAPNIIDGAPDTFWEPDRDDPLLTWWVEIDLGRAVSATKIVLRFVSEEAGDPFLQFNVLTSDGFAAFAGAKSLGFKVVGKTTASNRDQRLYEFGLSPSLEISEGWTGDIIRFIRIVVTDSNRDRAERVTQDEYEAMDPDRRGAVEHFVRSLTGEETPAPREVYESLGPDRRGGVQYYRRELPRLADVEIWTIGDNIGLDILGRGSIVDSGVQDPTRAFDGDFTTIWLAQVHSPLLDQGRLTVDMGTLFWVERIRLLNVPIREGPLKGYITKVSDGRKAPDGTLIWEVVSPKSREDNSKDRLLFIEDNLDPFSRFRFLEFTNIDITGVRSGAYGALSAMCEFQIYGEGYIPEITMSSGLIELGESRNLTSIEWDADTPPGTAVEIRTKTGDELTEITRFFNKGGEEITELAYNKLPGFSRGEVVKEFVPGGDWSSWSKAYPKSGDRIVSPSPREFLMIQIRLLSDDPDLFPALDFVTVNFRNPVAQQVLGEVSPDRDVIFTGQPRDFVFFIRPSFEPTNPGFNEILLEASSDVDMELLGVSLGRVEDFLNLSTEDFLPDGSGDFVGPSGDILEVIKSTSDSLWIHLPKLARRGVVDLIRVQFRSTIFLNFTSFEASVSNSSVPNSWQRVESGDATSLTASRSTSVSLPIEKGVVRDLRIEPNPFTPNGDGINDQVGIGFSVLKVNAPRGIKVRIYNLAGERVRELSEPGILAGRHEMLWSGEDEQGRIVPPGIYLCRINIDVDSGSVEDSTVHSLISVAY